MQNDHKVPFLGHRTATYRQNSKSKRKQKTGEYSYCYRKTTQRKPLYRMPFPLRNVYSTKLRKKNGVERKQVYTSPLNFVTIITYFSMVFQDK